MCSVPRLLPVRKLLVVAASLLLSAGCESVTRGPEVPMAAHAPLRLSNLAVSGRGPVEDAASTELRQVFADWAAARSAGDRAALEALYDVRHFEGVRLTRTGVEKRLTWAEWIAEERALVGHATVPNEAVFESWPGGTLDAATASVTFVEPGPTRRVLVFGRGADNRLRIVREELGSRDASTLASSQLNTLSRDAKVVRALAVIPANGERRGKTDGNN